MGQHIVGAPRTRRERKERQRADQSQAAAWEIKALEHELGITGHEDGCWLCDPTLHTGRVLLLPNGWEYRPLPPTPPRAPSGVSAAWDGSR